MPEFTINVNIFTPDLLTAAKILAAAQGQNGAVPIRERQPAAQPQPMPMPQQAPQVTPQPQQAPQVTLQPMPQQAPQPMPQPQATITPAGRAPVTQAPVQPVQAPTGAPSFSVALVAKAGADLMTANPSLQGPLMELIQRFGCQTVQELKPEQLPAFAAELRQMGARI